MPPDFMGENKEVATVLLQQPIPYHPPIYFVFQRINPANVPVALDQIRMASEATRLTYKPRAGGPVYEP